MKKKVFSLMMTLLLAFMGVAKADVVTVNDGTTTNEYLPLYGYWADYGAKSECIIPATAEGMSSLNGGTISKMTFYSSTTSQAWNAQWQVFLKEVTNTTMSDLAGTDGATIVYQGSLSVVNGLMEVNFTTPYTYNGGNLLIGMYMTSGGSGLHTYFYGVSAPNGVGYYRYGSANNGGSLQSFLPKTTFDYTSGGGGESSETASFFDFEDNQVPADWNNDATYPWSVVSEGPAGYNGNCFLRSSNSGVSSSTSSISATVTYVRDGSISFIAGLYGEGSYTYFDHCDFYIDGTRMIYAGATAAWVAQSFDVAAGEHTFTWSYTKDSSVNPDGDFFGIDDVNFDGVDAGGDTPELEPGLHTLAYYGVADNAEEVIDTLLIDRPNGAWMEPYHFQLFNTDDHSVDVVLIDFLYDNGYFSMDEETTVYPIHVANTGRPGVDLYINTNIEWTSTEVINSLLAVNTNERSTHLYKIVAAPYEPYCPDVVEKAYNIGTLATGTTWRMYASEMWEEENPNVEYDLHANYDLPDFEENIPDGYDAVMKFTADHDIMLNAYVSDGENGKVVLYRSDFAGEAGPMADNYYEGRPFTNTPGGGASGELTVHDGTVTNSYVPVYGLYTDAYLKCEMVYTASELSAMSGTDINSMKFYLSTPASAGWGNAYFQVFMAEVANNTINAFNGPGTIVYQGALDGTQPEMTINFTTPYHYNGGNLLVGIYNTVIGTYKSCYFYGETISGASYQGYNYNSLNSVIGTQRNFLPKTTFVYGGGRSNEFNGNARYMANRPATVVTTPMVTYSSEIANYMPTRGNATVILTADDVWQDGTGYQMLLDADATAYGDIIPTSGGLTSSGDASAATYAQFEYKIPTNADGSLYTSNIVLDNSVSIQIPAGTYDWCITNPTPGDRMWIASQYGTVGGRADDYVFEEGMIYEFHVYYYDATGNDATDVTITEDPYNPPTPPTPPTPVDPDQPVIPTPESFSAGPVIENLNVLKGTYYLLASSTDPDFEVVINAEELPCPIAAVTNIYPVDNDTAVSPVNLTLLWTLNDYCNEWRLVFSSTYWPEDEIDTEHPSTIVTEWSSDLQESFNISAALAAHGEQLWENTNYFWRIEQRSNPGTEYECYTSGPVFGFTTSFDVPANLRANGVEVAHIFETEEDVTLTWNRIYDRNRDDRTFRRYRIYWNGELYHETTINDVNDLSYTIPNSEFHYNMVPHAPVEFKVTAVYDEGESPKSTPAYVEVSGYGTISGTVYEQDETTPIGGVTVVINGTNEFGDPEEYTFTTNAQGYYEGEVHVGVYNNAMAYMDGYQSVQTTHTLPFNIVYQQETDHVDFIMDETFYYPAHVCARPVYTPSAEGDTLVQVWWEGWASDDTPFVPGGAFEAQIGEGTTTSTYAPFHTLWNYSLSETLYRADELAEAGVTGAAMTSLSYYVSSMTSEEPQNNINIWMANVSDNELTATSHITNNMTLVYTGNNVLPVAGQWNEFVFNQGNFSWDGQSNILIVCQRQNGDWDGSINWQTHNPGFLGMTYAYTDNAPGYNATSQTYSMSTSSTNRPNIIMKAGGREAAIGDMTRALHHFNIYRTDCYNDGPYNSGNTTFLASVWRPDTSYFDVNWPDVPVGVYKYGVSAVYSGNQADNPNNPRVDYPFEERESEIMWSDQCGPCIDKDMQTDITVNVVCNSADSPEGCVVSFTNLNEGEQFNHPQPSITLDGSGFQAITPFRKGDYLVTVYLPGYELLQVEESIWGHRDLRYVLTEIIYGVKNLYVSRTGWAMWDPETWEDFPIPEGAIVGPSVIDFETGDFSQFAFDNNGTYPWTVVQEGQEGSYCMKSGNGGVASSTSTISATVNYTMDGTIEFDYNSQGEGTTYDVSKFMIDGVQQFSVGADGTWRTFNADVAAGEHTFSWSYTKDSSVNPTGDCFLVDNINFNMGGSRAVAEERHLEGYKIMCTSLDDEPIFNHNTPVDQPFCQLTTVDPWSGQPTLIEGEYYKVKVATIYSTGQSPWSEAVVWRYEPCDHWGPVDEVTAGTMTQGNHIEWVFDHGYNPYAPLDPFDPTPTPGDDVTIVLTVDDVWGDGSGYQMLLDADANAYGGVIPESGALSTNCSGNEAIYAEFEYKIPTNADGNCSTQNMVNNNSVTVTIPAGTYDWCIANPTPGDRIWIASAGGTIGGRYDDFEFEAGNTYTFHVYFGGYNDATDLTVTGNGRSSFAPLASGEAKDIDHVAPITTVEFDFGGSFYHQYAEDGVALNFMALNDVYLRSYLLYAITKDERFELIAEEQYGKFVLVPAYEKSNFMDEFESFYEDARTNFSLMSKGEVTDQMPTWKSSVEPANYLSITMDLIMSNSRVENDHCITSLPFCTTEVISFEASTGSEYVDEVGWETSCYSSPTAAPRPAWYHMRIREAGPFVIHMEGHNPNYQPGQSGYDDADIDFCLWGPYTEEEMNSGYACTHLNGNKIIDCSWSAQEVEDAYLGYDLSQHNHSGLADNYSGTGTITYHVPEVGEYYILMITNYRSTPCVIDFTKTEGEGETDCEIVTPSDILGFVITMDGEFLAFAGPDDREFTHEGEFGDHEYCVRPIYPGLQQLPDSNFYFSMGCPVCASTNGEAVCDPGNPIYAEVNSTDDQVHLFWGEQPEPPTPVEGTTFMYDFENSSLEGLTTIDADGDGYNWVLGSAIGGIYLVDDASLAGSGHNASNDMICSGSYSNATGSALSPNNFLVFPQSTIVAGSTFSFWACGQDANYVAEHFGVAVSTEGNTSAADFTTIQEWTMTAKSAKATNAVRDGRAQGNWHQYTVDLSDYAGMDVYIAIRHFNCTDMFILDVDDVELSIAAKGNRDGIIGYNIYRSTDNVDYTLIATVAGDVTEYFDAPGAGTYYYQVTALYDGCESDPAISGENPDVNYVMVGVTGVGENSDNVNLFPNPTKGNVTIQAMNMHRITVVSVLGQVVFDTELDQDEYILNMSKFNTGMYMVRVYTDEGVTVKRVTVLH